MVHAILDGRKVQTRRIVKPQPTDVTFGVDTSLLSFDENLRCLTGGKSCIVALCNMPLYCPYGLAGDRLWVRESFISLNGSSMKCTPSKASYVCYQDGSQKFKASGEYFPWNLPTAPKWKEQGHKFRPSIHMPRWASRITLEIVSVRAERLQDISRGDAMAEGCPFPNMADGDDPRGWFAELWGQINGKEFWDANPWVWALSFKRVEA